MPPFCGAFFLFNININTKIINADKKLKSIFKHTKPVGAIWAIVFAINALPGCAQSRYNIQNTYVYTKEVFPGNIPVGRNGKPLRRGIDTVTIVYIETKAATMPAWNTAVKNGKNFSVSAIEVNEDSVIIGKEKSDSGLIIIKAKKGNRLWQLQFSEKETTTAAPGTKPNYQNQIFLYGIYEHKKISIPINKPVELLPELRP